MDGTPDTESALIIVCPEAEDAVGRHRRRHDRAAQFGVPAHVTVTFPFITLPEIEDEDESRLRRLFSDSPAFTIRGTRTDWFDDRVLFVALEDPTAVRNLTDVVTGAFPEYPPYGGAFDEVTPHLTIGHDQARTTLEVAERDAQQRLPFEQRVDRVELWSGPSTSGTIQENTWRRVRTYRLGR